MALRRGTPQRLAVPLDWGVLAPLRLVCAKVADGYFAGSHKSPRRGSGVEFGGHRPYLPGDDLRWLDRHALMRHGRLLVREFETDTERSIRIVLDISASMGYRSESGLASKLAYGAVLSAALSRVAVSGGDSVGLDWLGATALPPVATQGGRESVERVVSALEQLEVASGPPLDERGLARCLAPVAQSARRGSVVVLISDLLELPPAGVPHVAALAVRGRALAVVRLLDPTEADFPFEGAIKLRSVEGDQVVETDAAAVRAQYLERLSRDNARWRQELSRRGAAFVAARTDEDPVAALRRVLEALRLSS